MLSLNDGGRISLKKRMDLEEPRIENFRHCLAELDGVAPDLSSFAKPHFQLHFLTRLSMSSCPLPAFPLFVYLLSI